MNEIELIVELDPLPSEVEWFVPFVQGILTRLGVENWQMGLLITDNKRIRSYNHQYRGLDRATDVLSFVQKDGVEIPLPPGVPQEVGDIIISLEKVAENADEWHRSYDEEIRRVIIHGILHLNGYEHPGDDYSGEMLQLQEKLLMDSVDKLDKNS